MKINYSTLSIELKKLIIIMNSLSMKNKNKFSNKIEKYYFLYFFGMIEKQQYLKKANLRFIF